MHYFSWKWRFRVKNILLMDLYQLFPSSDVNWWTEVVWIIVMFLISCLDSDPDGTHSLQSIHCWVNDAMLHFSKSDEETNSSTCWMALEWEHFQLISFDNLRNSVKNQFFLFGSLITDLITERQTSRRTDGYMMCITMVYRNRFDWELDR